jgi:predicted RNase H-like HicB family nuclease
MKVTVILRPGRRGDTVQAFCPDLPGVSAFGRTDEEALAELRRRAATLTENPGSPPPGTRVVTLDL